MAIRQAAFELYRKPDVSAVTLSEVARRAKVPHTLVLYHYPTMDDLFFDVVHEVLNSLKEATVLAIQPHIDDPIKAMSAYTRAPFQWALRNPDLFSVWMNFYHKASLSDRYRHLNSEIRRLGRERIAAIVHRGMAENRFHLERGTDVGTLALEIQALITGAVILAFTEDELNAMSICGSIQDAILRRLGGIASDAKSRTRLRAATRGKTRAGRSQ